MILIGGENLIDFIQIDQPGENPVYQANPGGSPYNCAKALARQKVPVGYLTPISTDALGGLLAQGLSDAGVDIRGARREEPSSLAVVSLKEGVASYQFYRQDTAERMVSLDSLHAGIPTGTSVFHIGSLALSYGADAEIWTNFFVTMKKRGVLTSLDPNIRPTLITDRAAYMARFDRLLAATDLLKLSDEDLAWLYPGVDFQAAAKRLSETSAAKLVIVTLGAHGAFALIGDEKISVRAAEVNVMKDTVGAGDTFMATILAGLECASSNAGDISGKITTEGIAMLIGRAAVAAALNCEKSGCNPPTLSALEERLSMTT